MVFSLSILTGFALGHGGILSCWKFFPSSALRIVGVTMSSAIGFREFSEEDYRKFVQTLSDDELIKTGKHLRWLSGDGKIVSTMPSAFAEQLKICREEWRRRHPT
jgi:hypothetical protein